MGGGALTDPLQADNGAGENGAGAPSDGVWRPDPAGLLQKVEAQVSLRRSAAHAAQCVDLPCLGSPSGTSEVRPLLLHACAMPCLRHKKYLRYLVQVWGHGARGRDLGGTSLGGPLVAAESPLGVSRAISS